MTSELYIAQLFAMLHDSADVYRAVPHATTRFRAVRLGTALFIAKTCPQYLKDNGKETAICLPQQ
jgi:hypothetical protein